MTPVQIKALKDITIIGEGFLKIKELTQTVKNPKVGTDASGQSFVAVPTDVWYGITTTITDTQKKL